MIINQEANPVTTTGLKDSGAYVIEASAKAFEILSKGVYSDRILAVIRELSTNAYDSHVDAGTVDTPFELHLPNSLEPFFSIRDYGTGMSHEKVMTLYKTYFGSDKTKSNDFTGALGIGSKVPFSYSDAFTVTSYFGGMKRVYGAFLNDKRLPELSLMGEEETADPNGLEVLIAVENSDYREFENKARRILKRFSPLPIVKGVADFELATPEYNLEGTDWGLVQGARNGNAIALQGNIAYPIKSHSMEENITSVQRQLIDKLPVEIQFNIGDLDIAANREELGYDKKTVANILAKVDVVLGEMSDKLSEHFAACETLWDAKKLYGELFSGRSYDNPLSDLVQGNSFKIEWKGQEIKSSTFSLDLEGVFDTTVVYGFNCKGHRQRRNGNNVRHRRFTPASSNYNRVMLDPQIDVTLFYNDIGNGAVGRVNAFLDGDCVKQVYLFKTETKAELDKIRKFLGGVKIRNVSELPKPVRVAGAKGSGRGREIGNGYEWLGWGGWRKPARESWKKHDLDLTQDGVYVIIHNFEVLEGAGLTESYIVRSFDDVVKQAKVLGFIEEDAKIYGFARGHSNRVKESSTWVNFFDLIKEKLEIFVNDKNVLLSIANHNAWDSFTNSNHRVSSMMRPVEKIAALVNLQSSVTMLSNALTVMSKSEGPDPGSMKYLGRLVKVDFDTVVAPSYNLSKLYDDVLETYPLLQLFINNFDNLKQKDIKNVTEYINLIDAKPVDKKAVA